MEQSKLWNSSLGKILEFVIIKHAVELFVSVIFDFIKIFMGIVVFILQSYDTDSNIGAMI